MIYRAVIFSGLRNPVRGATGEQHLTSFYQEGDAKTKSTPVVLTINGIASPPGTTIGIK